MIAFGDRVARAWSSLYTRGLPAAVAERRREELASDLHEHATSAGAGLALQVAVLGRVLWGIPADLSWRRAARAPRLRRLETGASMTLRTFSTVVFGLYAVFLLWAGTGIISGGGLIWAAPFLMATVAVVLALRRREVSPRATTVVLVVSALMPAAVLFWMVVIFLPVGLLLTALAIASEPGRRAPQPVPA
jgi:hypothetical protein